MGTIQEIVQKYVEIPTLIKYQMVVAICLVILFSSALTSVDKYATFQTLNTNYTNVYSHV